MIQLLMKYKINKFKPGIIPYLLVMSLIPPSVVKVYAEQLGYSSADLSEEVLTMVAQELEYRLRELIQDASKYMTHCKRTRLTVEDLNWALRDRGQPQLYGYDPMESLSFRAVPNSDVFYVPHGDEVNLLDVLQEPLPRAPPPPSLTCHALAIEGVQPAIPENPVQHGDRVELVSQAVAGASAPRPPGVLAEEAEVKPLVKHVLSKELQLFYDALINDLMAFETRPDVSNAALNSLASDAGLQQLLPYLLQFIAEGVPRNLRVAAKLLTLMKAMTALLRNPYLYVEPYLHQMMPPVLTCLVGKRLAEQPGDSVHWEVRQEAAAIVAAICASYGSVYGSLVPRIAKTLLRAWLDADKPLTTHYGAIAGIAALGPQAIDSLLLPHIESYLTALRPEQHPGSTEHDMVFKALSRCADLWHESFDDMAVRDPRLAESQAMLNRLFRAMSD